MLYNRLLESVVKNLRTFNYGGEGNKAGGKKATFKTPEYGWIPGSIWRDTHLKKDTLEEITEAGFCAPTT